MKRVVVLLVAVAIATTVFAQGLKIAYVDVSSVFEASKETKKADEILKGEQAIAEKKVQDAYTALIEYGKKYQQESTFLSKEEQQKRSQEYIAKQEEFEKLRSETVKKLEQRSRELQKPIYESILAIVDIIRKEKGYDYILSASMVVSGNNQFDITNMVIERVNAGK